MKGKRLITVFIVIVFLTVSALGFFSVFTLKDIHVNFSVSDYNKTTSVRLINDLEKYKGKNLLFFNANDMRDVFDDYPYFEVISIKEKHPNSVELNVKERKETFLVNDNGQKYVLDEKGFIVAKDVYFAEKLVEIKGINLLNPTVGETAVCTEEIRTSLLSVVYDMSGLAQFSDQVESVTVMNMNNSYLEESWRVVFSMNTGVKIVITKAFENGALKMQAALEKFEDLDDYMKCYNYIVVSTIAETGKPQAVYTVDDEGIYGGEYA